MSRQANRIALVTGGSRGIGLATARLLGERGVHVLIGGRSLEGTVRAASGLRTAGLDVEAVSLDVTDQNNILSVAERIKEDHGRLDILINNAGIRIEEYGKLPSQQPLHQWRETFETNLFGMVSVTQALLPLLYKSPAGRIVNVSSLLASITTHCNEKSYAWSPKFKSLPAYSASKAAINSWTVHLAYELRDTSIKVNAAHPGYTKTDMNEGDGDLTPAEGAKTSVRLALLDANGPSGGYFHMDGTIPW